MTISDTSKQNIILLVDELKQGFPFTASRKSTAQTARVAAQAQNYFMQDES